MPLSRLGVTAQLATLIQSAIGPDYRVDQELDGGGMSRLFIATDLRHDRRVVVKVLSPELVTDQSTARFKREIELTVRLQHPHILPILTSGARDDALYYITPFIPGESLRERIARDHKLPLDDIVKILRDVSGALAFAHLRGIVHRDVKPGNILLAEGHAILADFGIARAVSTTATPLTGSGMVPGTPAYMAPELPTDEKADVYALGVVAYEMLCATLPPRGTTARDIVAVRGKVAGDSAMVVQAIAAAVADALSAAPDRRVQTAQEFLARIESVRSRKRLSPLLVGAGTVALLAASFATWTMLRPRTLDPTRFVVVPMNNSDVAAKAVQAALAEWRGVTVIDQSDVGAAISEQRTGITNSAARDIARRFRARNLVLVDEARATDSVVIRADVRDALADTTIRIKRVAYPSSASAAQQTMEHRRLANAMVRSGDELPWASAADDTAPSFPAWRAYDEGRLFLRQWNLAAAAERFRAAVSMQPRVAPAQLWLAQTLYWLGPTRAADARAAATRALDRHALLTTRDSLQAVGVLALATAYFPGACNTFDVLRRADSSSAVAWLGLGDCQAYDRAVVPDRVSPSGRHFRGSYETAARAYQRAAEIGPAFDSPAFQGWILGRLSRVLTSATNSTRTGVGTDSVTYYALPQLDHDTLAFHPVTVADLAAGRFAPPQTSLFAAVARNRTLMRRAAEEWVRRSPQDPVAYDSLATWVEVAGGNAMIGEKEVPAIGVVRRGLALARDSLLRADLAVKQVRLLVKAGQFREARVAAESLLASRTSAQPYVPGLAGVAALVGRVEQTARSLADDPDNARVVGVRGQQVTLPPQLAEASARLIARTSFGFADDSTISLARHVDELVGSYFINPEMALAVRSAILPPALAFVYPAGSDYLMRYLPSGRATFGLFRPLATGDSKAVRAQLASSQKERRFDPGTSIDMTLLRARIALMAGDTTAATRELDPVLRALPTIAPTLLTQVIQSAGFVRALVLRADIATRRGDSATATQCAQAVVELWDHADPPLQPIVQRMRQLAH